MSKTIMLVDDDADDLELLEMAIQKVDPGLICMPFIYPQKALDAIVAREGQPPDFIFIDINMPLLPGDQLLNEIRKHRSLDRVVVAMFSTSMPARIAQSLMEAGANHTFAKPIKISDYVSLISVIVSG